MPGVADGHHAHAHSIGFLNRQVHDLGGCDDTQAPVGIDIGGTRCLSNYLPVGAGVDVAALIAGDIALQHVGNTVGVGASQVGQHQNVGRQLSVCRLHTYLFEDGGDSDFKVIALNEHRIAKIDPKLL